MQAAVWSSSDAPCTLALTLALAGLHGPGSSALPAGCVLNVYQIDSAHNSEHLDHFILPTDTRRFAGGGAVTYSGVLQPHATMFFEVTPASS